MATTPEFMQFVCEQIKDVGNVRCRKMFGEYLVYVNEKPLLLVCDNTVYVRRQECIGELMQNAEQGYPYEGAKLHDILDMENAELVKSVLSVLERNTPAKQKRVARK